MAGHSEMGFVRYLANLLIKAIRKFYDSQNKELCRKESKAPTPAETSTFSSWLKFKILKSKT